MVQHTSESSHNCKIKQTAERMKISVMFVLEIKSSDPILIRFYVPPDTKKVILETFFPANLLALYTEGSLVGRLTSPFGTKIGYPVYRGQGLRWRFSSAKLRMVNDTVTSRPCYCFVQRRPKMGKIEEARLSYYASTYNRVETNQPPQDLFISSM